MPKHRRTPKLGQHFLKNASVAHSVAVAAGIESGDIVLEIGPGKGILTAELLALGARVIAIEKDPAMVAILNERFENEIRDKRLEIREEDARDFLATGHSTLITSFKVAANIPYYITGELLRLCLTAKHQPTALAFLVQKEVAERIARSKKESILSLSIKAYGTPKYVKTVSRGNFIPPPNVDSAILSVKNISRENFKNVSEENFFRIIKAGFAQKRKTLSGNLKRVFGASAEHALTKLSVDLKSRAEDVPLNTWLELSRTLSEH